MINISFGFAFCADVIAALLIPLTAALVHVNIAPLAVLVGVYVKAVLVQIAGGVKELLNVGEDPDEYVNVNGSDAIPFAVTANEYVPVGNPTGKSKVAVSGALPLKSPVLFQFEVLT